MDQTSKLRPALVFGAGAVTALVVGGSAAFAANGDALLIGRDNKGQHVTTLKNGSGVPLSLEADSGSAPLKVDSKKKVSRLNADYLDGNTGSDYALKSGSTGVIMGSEDDTDGFVDTARCPSGTKSTGGGGIAAGTETDALWYSGPDFNANTGAVISNSWFAGSVEGLGVAFVYCYNPRGAVTGATTHVFTPSTAASALGSQVPKSVAVRKAQLHAR